MARTPPDFGPDVGLLGVEGGNVSSGFEGGLLSRPRVVGGHSPYGPLGIREDGDRAVGVALLTTSSRIHLYLISQTHRGMEILE